MFWFINDSYHCTPTFYWFLEYNAFCKHTYRCRVGFSVSSLHICLCLEYFWTLKHSSIFFFFFMKISKLISYCKYCIVMLQKVSWLCINQRPNKINVALREEKVQKLKKNFVSITRKSRERTHRFREIKLDDPIALWS